MPPLKKRACFGCFSTRETNINTSYDLRCLYKQYYDIIKKYYVKCILILGGKLPHPQSSDFIPHRKGAQNFSFFSSGLIKDEIVV